MKPDDPQRRDDAQAGQRPQLATWRTARRFDDVRFRRPAGPRRAYGCLPADWGRLAGVRALGGPFLPVDQTTAQVQWPSAQSGTAPVDSPLVALRPETMDATFGCAAIRSLDARTDGPATV